MHIKTILSILLSVPATWVIELMKYVYQDWEFAKWIVVAIIVDTLAGLVKHWVHADVSSESFWHKFAKKIFIYMILLITSHVLSNFTVQGHLTGAMDFLGEYLCVMMMIREAISILENVNAIVPIIPVWVLKRLKDFNEKGEYINKKEN